MQYVQHVWAYMHLYADDPLQVSISKGLPHLQCLQPLD